MNLTYEKARSLHRALWNWLAKNPGKGKIDWPYWNRIPFEVPEAHCWACAWEAFLRTQNPKEEKEMACFFCPIAHVGNSAHCIRGSHPYYKWLRANTDGKEEEATYWALAVRNAWK